MPTTSPTLVTVADVAAVFEDPIPPERENVVDALISYALARLERLKPQLQANLASGAVSADLARFAIVSAVCRVLRNPAGYSAQTAGEFSYQLAASAGQGQLTFTAQELSDCTPISVAAPGAVGVGAVRGVIALAPARWADTTDGPISTYSDPWSW